MAKKRREKTDEEEIDFKIPKFDEEKFLKRERRNIRTLFISFEPRLNPMSVIRPSSQTIIIEPISNTFKRGPIG